MAGFEPTNARVKVWCLTAWRHPNIWCITSTSDTRNIISCTFLFCNPFFKFFCPLRFLLLQQLPDEVIHKLPALAAAGAVTGNCLHLLRRFCASVNGSFDFGIGHIFAVAGFLVGIFQTLSPLLSRSAKAGPALPADCNVLLRSICPLPFSPIIPHIRRRIKKVELLFAAPTAVGSGFDSPVWSTWVV